MVVELALFDEYADDVGGDGVLFVNITDVNFEPEEKYVIWLNELILFEEAKTEKPVEFLAV